LKKLGLENLKIEINSLGNIKDRIKYKEVLKEYLKDKALSEESINRYNNGMYLRILDSKSEKDQEIIKNCPKLLEVMEEKSKKRFEEVLKGLSYLNIPYEINYNLVRGLDYYSDTIFEFKIENSKLGKQQDTILGGGRYNLTEILGGPKIESIGFVIFLNNQR
jgi:histidyl-tRNA synthetase